MFRVLCSIVVILHDGRENADSLGTERPILQCSQTVCKAPPTEPAVSKRRQPLEFLFFGVRIAHYLLMLQDEVPIIISPALGEMRTTHDARLDSACLQVRVQAVEGRRDRVTFCKMSFIM